MHLVEFAIVLPLLLLLIMGIIQFSIIFSAQTSLTNAAREGVRAASVGSKESEVIAEIKDSYTGNSFLPDFNEDLIKIHPSIGTEDKRKVGDSISVTLKNVNVKLFVPMPKSIFPNGEISLNGNATMRIEDVPTSKD